MPAQPRKRYKPFYKLRFQAAPDVKAIEKIRKELSQVSPSQFFGEQKVERHIKAIDLVNRQK